MEINLEMVKCLCGSEDSMPRTIIHLIDGRDMRIVECKDCGLQYMNPRPDKEFLNLMYKTGYYNTLIADKDTWAEKTIKLEIEKTNLHLSRLKPILKMKNRYGYKTLLDIGTGTGYFLKLAKDRGFDVIGIEVSERASEFAMENYGIPILNISGVEDAGFKDNSFDVVTLCHVIEHLPYPESILREMYRILRNNGVIFVATPNYRTIATLLSRLNRILGYPVKPLEDPYVIKTWKDGCYHLQPKRLDDEGYMIYFLHASHHIYFFNPRALKGLLIRNNFSIEAYPSGRYDYGAMGIRRLFSNRPINLLARIFNLQTEIMFYARKA